MLSTHRTSLCTSVSNQLIKWPFDTNEDITLRKEARFKLGEHQVFGPIANRILLMTAKPKSMVSDKLTVTNYGLGGHYLPHNSYIDQDHSIRKEDGLALIIFHVTYTFAYLF